MSQDKILLPGLIDVHVHLRDPGQTTKEDFISGTKAALAGGFTTIVDMPNNAQPITSLEKLEEKITIAKGKTLVELGFHFGSLGDNLDQFPGVSDLAIGLKLYLNKTTGGYLLDIEHLRKIYQAWPEDKVVLLHSEEDTIDLALESLRGLNRPVHICHMPSKEVLEKIIKAKRQGYNLTCGVTPHHLFLSELDTGRIGDHAKMLPSLKSERDQDYLWENFDQIDIVESDHAPHTLEDKVGGAFGVPGLETTLPLLLSAYKQGKISIEQIIDKCHTRPKEIFNLEPEDYLISIKMESYELDPSQFFSKAQWSPFAGMVVPGKVSQVTKSNQVIYSGGEFLINPGEGKVIYGK
ncbi:dihydroorotase family protein [Candidatus Saccharibacteria bacterium]|nr:dihydroorotase family protein [Candidatus Saccharibacteria bacterium]MCB9834442.1 dihydroorotase family protein [Candidatus Nomurabacteria bacterium]